MMSSSSSGDVGGGGAVQQQRPPQPPAVTTITQGQQQHQQHQQQHPFPLLDLFLDVPHPAASSSCPPPFLIGPPPRTAAAAASSTSSRPDEELTKNIPQIARFAFPEYDETAQGARPPPQQMNRYDVYAMQSKSFQHFTFGMQLSTGTRVHGHVRRYLPPHLIARSRYDVGRRGERALVILTRASGADLLYAAVLKSIEAISSQQAAQSKDVQPHDEPQKWFLHELFRHHEHLMSVYAAKPAEERGKPLICSIDGLEIASATASSAALYGTVDSSRFMFPASLLYDPSRNTGNSPAATTTMTTTAADRGCAASSILPLLRCVGVAHALRIMSALLSERRVIMASASPTRLATCTHAAVAMLSAGVLTWQHLFIPVLPPHLWQYLAAPYPYLIGILQQQVSRLDGTDGLGEVLLIHLDSNAMETRGMSQQHILQRLPDLFQNQEVQQYQQQAGAAASASELLAQDLVELLKQDKKQLYGDNALAHVGETAAKAGKAIKSGFLKLRDKGKKYLQQRSGNSSTTAGTSGTGAITPPEEAAADEVEASEDSKSLAGDYIYTEGCHNELAEEDARIAFTSFFLCMFGNMRWYLSGHPGQIPQLDRNRYLQQKRSMGEGEGTPIWPLLQNLCQTQMLEEFAKQRVEEVRVGAPVTADAPLFLKCAAHHRQHAVDFTILAVRRVARQVAASNPGRLTGLLQTNARRQCMALTSNRPYDAGDASAAIASLVEQARESSSVLFDVMSVIWLRLRDSKGMQWKHGYSALQILKNLLYHGPLAAVAEATDGLERIRALKSYENMMRTGQAQMIRAAARQVYDLLVDRAKLFFVRRFCADRRRQLQAKDGRGRLVKDLRLKITVPFATMHVALNPNARGTVVQIPPEAPSQQRMINRGPPQQQQQQQQLHHQQPQQQQPTMQETDLLGMMSPPPAQQQQQQQQVLAAATAAAPAAATPAEDMLGLFDTLTVSASSNDSVGSQQQQQQNQLLQLQTPATTTTTTTATTAAAAVSDPFSLVAPAQAAAAPARQPPAQQPQPPVPATAAAAAGAASQQQQHHQQRQAHSPPRPQQQNLQYGVQSQQQQQQQHSPHPQPPAQKQQQHSPHPQPPAQQQQQQHSPYHAPSQQPAPPPPPPQQPRLQQVIPQFAQPPPPPPQQQQQGHWPQQQQQHHAQGAPHQHQYHNQQQQQQAQQQQQQQRPAAAAYGQQAQANASQGQPAAYYPQQPQYAYQHPQHAQQHQQQQQQQQPPPPAGYGMPQQQQQQQQQNPPPQGQQQPNNRRQFDPFA